MATDQPSGSPVTGAVIDPERYARLRAEQSLPLALFAGIGAALVGAAIWAAVTVATEYQIGIMAIAIGFIVGYAVRLGKGIDKVFGIVGAFLSLLGCVLGNALSLIAFVSKQHQLGLFETLSQLDYNKFPQLMVDSFSAMDLLFYGIAVYEGYRFSFRQLTGQDLGSSETVEPKAGV